MANYSEILLLLLCSVFQVANGYTYSYAGLVASSVVAFVMLIISVSLLIMILLWEQWFPKFMYNRGKVKGPREVKRKPRSLINGGMSYTESEIRYPSVSGSTRQMGMTPRSELIVPVSGNKTDSWIQEIPTPRYDESSQQIQFGEEDDEEQVIVTELIDVHDATPADTSKRPEVITAQGQKPDISKSRNETYTVISKSNGEVKVQNITGQTSQHVTSGGDFFFGAESIEEAKTDFRSPDEEEKMVLY